MVGGSGQWEEGSKLLAILKKSAICRDFFKSFNSHIHGVITFSAWRVKRAFTIIVCTGFFSLLLISPPQKGWDTKRDNHKKLEMKNILDRANDPTYQKISSRYPGIFIKLD